MEITEEGGTYKQVFDSWGDFVDYAERRPGCNLKDASRSERDWAGTRTFSDALKLARDGWSEGEELAKKFSLGLVESVSQLIDRPVFVHDTEGHGIDVALFVEGEPECWVRQEERITEGPGRRIIQITMNAAVSSGVSKAVILQRGAVVAALVELLETAGHGVSLTITAVADSRNSRMVCFIPVKSADQPLDLPRVAFASAHPAMFRRMIFSAWEGAPAKVRMKNDIVASGGYGSPGSLREGEDRGDIYVNKGYLLDWHVSSPQAAKEWLIGELKKQGVVLRGGDDESR